jgi:hypothetical protein
MRASGFKFSKKVWVFVGLGFCGFLVLGAYGWKATLEGAGVRAGWDTVLENTVQLATGEVAIVVSEKFDEHWTLKAAKWGVKVVLAAALIQSILIVFHRQIRQLLFRRTKGHEVYAGLGLHNADLALAACARGARVSVVSANPDHPIRGKLEESGGLFVAGCPTDTQKLKAAGAGKAARVVAASEHDDTGTIGIAEAVSSMERSGGGRLGEILACIESADARELLNRQWKLVAAPGAWRARTIGFEAAAMRNLVADAALALSRIPHALESGPCLLVAAEDPFARAFLRAAIPFLQISGSAVPNFFVAVDDPREEVEFRMLYPDVDLVANVVFVETPDRMVPFHQAFFGCRFDLAVVHLKEEASTLQLSGKILSSPRFAAAGVHAVTMHRPSTQLLETPGLKVCSIFEMGIQSPEFGELSLEEEARDNHAAYLAGLQDAERAKAKSYDGLPEAHKESNRWAVLHRRIKRELWSSAAGAGTPQFLEHLAICEHQRWMGEKIIQGWTYGETRDDGRLLHPDIRSYSDLSPETKEKDRVQVRKALGLAPGA